jgi:hypothetical protein
MDLSDMDLKLIKIIIMHAIRRKQAEWTDNQPFKTCWRQTGLLNWES